jgi:hypothetical protein
VQLHGRLPPVLRLPVGPGQVRGVAIDPTGRCLLYAPHDTNGPSSLVLRDLETGTDEIVSNQPASAGTAAVSAGGRDVVFQSAADNIVPGTLRPCGSQPVVRQYQTNSTPPCTGARSSGLERPTTACCRPAAPPRGGRARAEGVQIHLLGRRRRLPPGRRECDVLASCQ